MTIQTIQEFNATGLDGILIYLSTNVPVFIPSLLIFLYIAVGSIIYLGSRRFGGQGDIFAAFSAAGFFTVVIGTILTFSFGIINWAVLSIIIGIAILSIILLLIRRERD